MWLVYLLIIEYCTNLILFIFIICSVLFIILLLSQLKKIKIIGT